MNESIPKLPKLPLPKEEGDHTRIFFSGVSGAGVFPERLIQEHNPFIMLSFYDLKTNTKGSTAWQRFRTYHKHEQNHKPRKVSPSA
jgi:hypothetical protein